MTPGPRRLNDFLLVAAVGIYVLLRHFRFEPRGGSGCTVPLRPQQITFRDKLLAGLEA